jgi:uncharacterized membrane protein
LWHLGSESAWIDEAYSIELAKHSVVEILKGTAADQHPPLYYLLLRLWLIFGSGVTYARLLSVIIGVINVGQVLHFGKKSAGIAIGLLGGLLVAVSPMHVWYSQEIRMYILLVSLTTASTTALWWALRGNQIYRWILFCLFSTLALYTHYFAAFVLLAQGIWVLNWVWKQRAKRSLWYWIGSVVATGILFLPWLPVAINQTRLHTMTWVESPTLNVIRVTLLRLIFGIAVLPWPDLLLWIVTGILLALFIWSIKNFLSISSENNRSYFYIANWAVIPFVSISIIALIYPVYQFKQYLIVLPPILLLAAWISYSLPRKAGIATIIVLLISATVSLTYQQIYLTKDDWKGAANFIDHNSSTGDIIYANPAASSLALSLYSEITIPFIGTPADYDIITGGWEGDALTPKSVDDELSQLNSDYQRLWLVEFFPEFWDENKIVETWLEQNSKLLDDLYFGRIRIRIYSFTN